VSKLSNLEEYSHLKQHFHEISTLLSTLYALRKTKQKKKVCFYVLFPNHFTDQNEM